MVKQLIHQHRVTVTIVFRHGSSGNAKHKIPIVKKVEVGGGDFSPLSFTALMSHYFSKDCVMSCESI